MGVGFWQSSLWGEMQNTQTSNSVKWKQILFTAYSRGIQPSARQLV
jgi:hypothetical protein